MGDVLSRGPEQVPSIGTIISVVGVPPLLAGWLVDWLDARMMDGSSAVRALSAAAVGTGSRGLDACTERRLHGIAPPNTPEHPQSTPEHAQNTSAAPLRVHYSKGTHGVYPRGTPRRTLGGPGVPPAVPPRTLEALPQEQPQGYPRPPRAYPQGTLGVLR